MPNIYLTINHYNKDNNLLPWRYIGSDQNDNSLYLGSSEKLKEDIQKLGVEHFSKTIIEKFDDISNKELRYIEAEHLYLNNVKNDSSYYNLTDKYAPGGGKKGMKMKPRTEEHLKNWSKSRKGWIPSDNTRKIWKTQRTGRKASNETKEKMSIQRVGENNSNALFWEITTPTGQILTIRALRHFCRKNNLPFHRMYNNTFLGWNVLKFGKGQGGGRKPKQNDQ